MKEERDTRISPFLYASPFLFHLLTDETAYGSIIRAMDSTGGWVFRVYPLGKFVYAMEKANKKYHTPRGVTNYLQRLQDNTPAQIETYWTYLSYSDGEWNISNAVIAFEHVGVGEYSCHGVLPAEYWLADKDGMQLSGASKNPIINTIWAICNNHSRFTDRREALSNG